MSEEPIRALTPVTFLPLNWELERCKGWDQSQEGGGSTGEGKRGVQGLGGAQQGRDSAP